MDTSDWSMVELLGKRVIDKIYDHLRDLRIDGKEMPGAIAVSQNGIVGIECVIRRLGVPGIRAESYTKLDWEVSCGLLLYGAKVYTDKRLGEDEISFADSLPIWAIDYNDRVKQLDSRGHYVRPDNYHDWFSTTPIIINVPKTKSDSMHSVYPPPWRD